MERILELTHKNGNITELKPVSFRYNIEHHDKPLYNEDDEFCGYEIDYYGETPIEQLLDIFMSDTPRDPVDITELFCEQISGKDYTDLDNIWKSLLNPSSTPYKCDIVSDGKLTFIGEPTEITALFRKEIVKDLTFSLYNCIPTSKTNNKIGFCFDFMRAYVGEPINS